MGKKVVVPCLDAIMINKAAVSVKRSILVKSHNVDFLCLEGTGSRLSACSLLKLLFFNLLFIQRSLRYM